MGRTRLVHGGVSYSYYIAIRYARLALVQFSSLCMVSNINPTPSCMVSNINPNEYVFFRCLWKIGTKHTTSPQGSFSSIIKKLGFPRQPSVCPWLSSCLFFLLDFSISKSCDFRLAPLTPPHGRPFDILCAFLAYFFLRPY